MKVIKLQTPQSQPDQNSPAGAYLYNNTLYIKSGGSGSYPFTIGGDISAMITELADAAAQPINMADVFKLISIGRDGDKAHTYAAGL